MKKSSWYAGRRSSSHYERGGHVDGPNSTGARLRHFPELQSARSELPRQVRLQLDRRHAALAAGPALGQASGVGAPLGARRPQRVETARPAAHQGLGVARSAAARRNPPDGRRSPPGRRRQARPQDETQELRQRRRPAPAQEQQQQPQVVRLPRLVDDDDLEPCVVRATHRAPITTTGPYLLPLSQTQDVSNNWVPVRKRLSSFWIGFEYDLTPPKYHQLSQLNSLYCRI